MYQPRTGYYPSVKSEVRAKFELQTASIIYQQCQAARILALKSTSRSDIVDSWGKLPVECSGYEETKQCSDWKELAQFPMSWTFIPISKIDRSKHETCDWKRKNLSDSYDRATTSLSRSDYMEKYMPKECEYTLPTSQVDFI